MLQPLLSKLILSTRTDLVVTFNYVATYIFWSENSLNWWCCKLWCSVTFSINWPGYEHEWFWKLCCSEWYLKQLAWLWTSMVVQAMTSWTTHETEWCCKLGCSEWHLEELVWLRIWVALQSILLKQLIWLLTWVMLQVMLFRVTCWTAHLVMKLSGITTYAVHSDNSDRRLVISFNAAATYTCSEWRLW